MNSPTCNVGNPCQLTTLSPKGLGQSHRDCPRPLGPIDSCPFQSVGCIYGYCCRPPIGEPKHSITAILIPLLSRPKPTHTANYPANQQSVLGKLLEDITEGEALLCLKGHDANEDNLQLLIRSLWPGTYNSRRRFIVLPIASQTASTVIASMQS